MKSKIVKRSWVLHECLERVPEDFDAMHALLTYGLRGTDLEAMVALGKRTDYGRSVVNVICVCVLLFVSLVLIILRHTPLEPIPSSPLSPSVTFILFYFKLKMHLFPP